MSSTNYVKTPSEIHAFAVQLFTAQATAVEGKQTYLRALAATTRAQLEQTKGDPLETLEKINESFYAEVLKAAQEATSPRTPNRAETLNRKTNFARSSMSVLRAWVRNGGDLLKLAPARVTKGALAVPHKARPPSAARLQHRAESRAEALVASLTALGATSPGMAAATIEDLIGQLTEQLGAVTRQAKAHKRLAAAHSSKTGAANDGAFASA